MKRLAAFEDFIRQLKDNQPLAQEKLYQQYTRYLFSVCKRYIRNEMLCQEIHSNSFLKIFLNVGKAKFENEQAFKNWMKKITINEALQSVRRQKLICFTSEDELDHQEFSLTINSEMDELNLIEEIMSLPDGYRTVFCLYVIDGYNHYEIAEKLGINVGTSKSQLYKARILLQNKINKNKTTRYEIFK